LCVCILQTQVISRFAHAMKPPNPVKSKELKGAECFLMSWQSFSKFRILFIL